MSPEPITLVETQQGPETTPQKLEAPVVETPREPESLLAETPQGPDPPLAETPRWTGSETRTVVAAFDPLWVPTIPSISPALAYVYTQVCRRVAVREMWGTTE